MVPPPTVGLDDQHPQSVALVRISKDVKIVCVTHVRYSPQYRRRLFPESKILHWFVQIALGLHYMHGQRVLHRDLKTQNIFLLGNGRLVLGDLGISKVRLLMRLHA